MNTPFWTINAKNIMKVFILFFFFLLALNLVIFSGSISAKELNLEIVHEDDPSDLVSSDQENESNLLPPLMNNKSDKNINLKGDVLITEDFLDTKQVDGAEIKVKVNTD